MIGKPQSQGRQDDPRVLEALRKVWGYDKLRPLQAEAIAAGLSRRDALVVMPTGGGKSLCYQVPPLVAGRTDVVISPLIALMKDQVDGLRELGYPAAALHSNLTGPERQRIEHAVCAGEYRLIYVAPNGRSPPGSWPPANDSASTRSPSTRPTASASGDTTSAPNIASWLSCGSDSHGPASMPIRPPPHRACATTSLPSCGCAIP